MTFHENRQTILMKYYTLFFRKLGKKSQNLSSAVVVIGALRVIVTLPKRIMGFVKVCLFKMRICNLYHVYEIV